MTKRHRKKWVDALSLVLPVLLFFAVLNCFTTYLYYQDYQCKMDILTEVAAGAETTGMDAAAGWLKGSDHQANEQGKQLLEQYGYWENKGTSFYVRFRQNIMITGFVRIEIEDQGIGIPQSEYHKIFQRFYRGTAPEVREKSGTGIGLYLSRQIIEQHGGTITVASGKVRKGSTFLIQLPENGLS